LAKPPGDGGVEWTWARHVLFVVQGVVSTRVSKNPLQQQNMGKGGMHSTQVVEVHVFCGRGTGVYRPWRAMTGGGCPTERLGDAATSPAAALCWSK
jgi:hypothetical protein